MTLATVHTTKCRGYNIAAQLDDETGAAAIVCNKGQSTLTFAGAIWAEARDAMREALGYAPETPYSPECS